MKKPLLPTSVLILAGLLFCALPATAQNWYGHVGTTFYWDDSKTTLVGTRVVSSCVDSLYQYQDGQVTSNVTHDVHPCNSNGSATYIQIAPWGSGVGTNCSYSVYVDTGDHWEYIGKTTGVCMFPPLGTP